VKTEDDVHGWDAAARVAGRSVGSLRKALAAGRLASTWKRGRHVFRRGDLLRLRRGPDRERGQVAGAGNTGQVAQIEGQHEQTGPTDEGQAAGQLSKAVGHVDDEPGSLETAPSDRFEEVFRAIAGLRTWAEMLGGSIEAVTAMVARQEAEIAALRRHSLTRALAGDVMSLAGRLGAVEQALRHLPREPLLVERACSCGGQLFVAAGCSRCGRGVG